MSWVCKSCLVEIKESGEEQESTRCPVCRTAMEKSAPERSIRQVTVKAFDRYDLIERVGSGHFGNVWLAFDTKLKRQVALKIPRYLGTESDDQKLFLREGQTAAHLNHPGIVTVFEVGVEANCVYIVSEFVAGGTLEKHLKDYTPTVTRAVDYAVEIVRALAHAHDNHVIHRDLKPGNILLTKEGRLKIADFGLAKKMTDDSDRTKEGDVFGTLAYMSPEQASADHGSVDRRTDLYAFGVILYEMLSRQRPFNSRDPDFSRQLRFATPISPSTLNALVPAALDKICLRCLEKQPKDRYSSAQQIEADLRRWQAEQKAEVVAETVVTPGHQCEIDSTPTPSIDPRSMQVPSGSLPSTLANSRTQIAFSRRQKILLFGFFGLLILLAGGYFGNGLMSRVEIDAAAIPSPKEPPDEGPGIVLPKEQRVRITTNPAGAQIVVWDFHPQFGILDNQHFRVAKGRSPVELMLPPGDYFIVAAINDERFHEVLRRVPVDPSLWPDMSRNRRYTFKDGVTELREIEIPDTTTVEVEMARVQSQANVLIGTDEPELPRHRRAVPAFLIDSKEVTFGEMRKFYKEQLHVEGKLPLQSFSDRKDFPDDDVPVNGIMWNDAACYAELIGKRLPFESEYEVAATNLGQNKYPWGDAEENIVPWTFEPAGIPEHDKVVLSGVAVFGLFSNVAEWTINRGSCYPPPFKGEMKPQLSLHQHIIRGGPLKVAERGDVTDEDLRMGSRSHRLWFSEELRPMGVGFRCARSLRPRLNADSTEKILE